MASAIHIILCFCANIHTFTHLTINFPHFVITATLCNTCHTLQYLSHFAILVTLCNTNQTLQLPATLCTTFHTSQYLPHFVQPSTFYKTCHSLQKYFVRLFCTLREKIFFWSLFSRISELIFVLGPYNEKHGPEKTPYPRFFMKY